MDRETSTATGLSRRAFLGRLGVGALAFGGLSRWAWSEAGRSVGETVAEIKFARLVSLGEGVWVVVSKPLEGGYDTLCNGGIVAGKERVLAFDSYASAGGAGWVVEQAKTLTGRLPTDLVLSHHHGDHVGGLSAFTAAGEPPRIWLTQAIQERVSPGQLGAVRQMLASATILAPGETTAVDLGGRSVMLTPFSGHTRSDVVAQVEGRATFCGDLLWNQLFPNYVDATPGELKRTVATLLAASTAIKVPGHGPLPDAAALTRYSNLLDEIETTARTAFAAGKSPEEAARGYQLPAALGSWTLFNPRYFQVAFTAWHRELGGEEGA